MHTFSFSLMDGYLWVLLPFDISFSIPFRVSSRFGLGTGSSSFPCCRFVYIVIEAARNSTWALSFSSFFSILDRFLLSGSLVRLLPVEETCLHCGD